MSRADVRQALLEWFSPPAIGGLSTVFQAMPWWASGTTWEFDVVNGWASIGYIHLAEDAEQRIALGGEFGGMKLINYQVGLVLLFKYLVPDPLPIDSDPSEWVVYLDTLIEETKERIRADRTFGTGGVIIWQAGGGDGTNTPDIVVQSDIPTLDNGIIQCWQAITFSIQEVITA